MKKNTFKNILAILAVIFVVWFVYDLISTKVSISQKGVVSDDVMVVTADENGWRETILVDVLTGEEFAVSNFAGTPILLESFAVWCPTCLKQQREIKKVQDSLGEAVVHISLDTDPNEDADIVIDHANRNGFDWIFAVPPADMTRALIDDFGLGFVNAPAAPVVLICEDQSGQLLRRGVKPADALEEVIAQTCNF